MKKLLADCSYSELFGINVGNRNVSSVRVKRKLLLAPTVFSSRVRVPERASFTTLPYALLEYKYSYEVDFCLCIWQTHVLCTCRIDCSCPRCARCRLWERARWSCKTVRGKWRAGRIWTVQEIYLFLFYLVNLFVIICSSLSDLERLCFRVLWSNQTVLQIDLSLICLAKRLKSLFVSHPFYKRKKREKNSYLKFPWMALNELITCRVKKKMSKAAKMSAHCAESSPV